MFLHSKAVALAIIFGLPLAGTCLAHVVPDPREAAPGKYFRTAFRVTHGCQGSATVAVSIRIPDGVMSVKPQPKPGWTIELQTRPVEPPVHGPHGHHIHEAVSEVTWRGGNLPDAYFDEFVLSMRMPDQPGTTLYFPVVQTCEKGKLEWTAVPAPGQQDSDAPDPAPSITLRSR
jgi:uncharacterized protein YcnI